MRCFGEENGLIKSAENLTALCYEKGRLKFQTAFTFNASTINLNTLECPRRLE